MTAKVYGVEPTIQDGWQTIIDGITIHRWYLAPHRHLEALLQQRWEEARAAVGGVPDLDSLRRRWTRGALLQLLHRETDIAQVLPLVRSRRSPTGGLVAAGRLTSDGELLVEPERLAASDLEIASSVNRALALLRIAGLAELRRISVDIIAALDKPVPYALAWRIGGAAIPVTIGASAVELMVQLGCGAALQYLHGIGAYYSPPELGHAPLFSPLSGTEVAAADLAGELVAVGTAHRLLTELERRRTDLSADEVLTRDEVAALDELLHTVSGQVKALSPVAYDCEGKVELTCFETVNVSFPGPRQFEKYERGYGLGQS